MLYYENTYSTQDFHQRHRVTRYFVLAATLDVSLSYLALGSALFPVAWELSLSTLLSGLVIVTFLTNVTKQWEGYTESSSWRQTELAAQAHNYDI